MKNLPFISSEIFCYSFWNNNFRGQFRQLSFKFCLKNFFRIFPEELGGWCFFLTSNLNSEKKICAQGFRPGVQCVTVDDFDKRLNSSRLWRPLAVTRHRCYQFPLSAMHLEVFLFILLNRVGGNNLNLVGTRLSLIENWK